MRLKLCIFFLFFALSNSLSARASLDSLLSLLDKTMGEYAVYVSKREARIRELKKQETRLNLTSSAAYELNKQLYEEYRAYVCDSAIVYLNRNIEIGEQTQRTDYEYESKLLLSLLLGSSGMYKEAVDILETIERSLLPDSMLVDYYVTYEHVYGELAFYTQDTQRVEYYRSISDQYKDSLILLLLPDDELWLTMQETNLRNAGRYAEALEMNDIRLAKTTEGTAKHALVTFHRSLIFRNKDDVETQKYYLALSALSDIRSAIKDHASLWTLAQILYAEGDIERAYVYIRFSWSETVLYNARLRSLQSAGILSLIDKTYQAMVEKQNRELQYSLILISVLLLVLLAALVYIYRQMKRLSVARNNLQTVNGRLKELNEELQQMNVCLQSANLDLSESNQIKEEYIGRFIKLCSVYIDKLDVYRRMVHKKITDGHIAELLKMTRSQNALDDEVKRLYTNFDTAFLQLFPDFVTKFNALLQEDDPIVLKKGELLNTELRIFALIRLGIEDSSQIAEFLRYSVNTIYNYRAKVKNRARVTREEFERLVRMIR